jgi:hypothetical protein
MDKSELLYSPDGARLVMVELASIYIHQTFFNKLSRVLALAVEFLMVRMAQTNRTRGSPIGNARLCWYCDKTSSHYRPCLPQTTTGHCRRGRSRNSWAHAYHASTTGVYSPPPISSFCHVLHPA